MKKVINGKLYNSDTAALAVWSNMADTSDFHWYREWLHQKRTGEFFLYGEGGPMTQYAVSIGQNCWTGGEKIIPLTSAKAREWAEEHLDADEYAEIFGMPDEDDELHTLCIQLPRALVTKIKMNAADAGISVKAYVEKILRNNI